MHYTVSFYTSWSWSLFDLFSKGKIACMMNYSNLSFFFLVSINMNLRSLRYGLVSWKLFGCLLLHYLHRFRVQIQIFFQITSILIIMCLVVRALGFFAEWSWIGLTNMATKPEIAFLSHNDTEKHSVINITQPNLSRPYLYYNTFRKKRMKPHVQT